MKHIPELDVFAGHTDWWDYDENRYFVPTEKAPPEAVEAMRIVNEMTKREEAERKNSGIRYGENGVSYY